MLHQSSHLIWFIQNKTNNKFRADKLLDATEIQFLVWNIWPTSVNSGNWHRDRKCVSITHWQGLIHCHTHGSSWVTAGLLGPADIQIWKGLTNYWGVRNSLEMLAAQLHNNMVDNDMKGGFEMLKMAWTDKASGHGVIKWTTCPWIFHTHWDKGHHHTVFFNVTLQK